MNIEGIDELDNRILETIKDNARLTYKEIGDIVGISRVSVKNRMDAMQEKGIIRGFKTAIDPTNVPEGTLFFLDIECCPENYEDTAEYLSKNKMIRRIYSTSGECRIHAVGYANNASNLKLFTNTIYRSKLGVRRISCHTVLSTLMDIDGGVEYVRYQENEHLEEGSEPAEDL